MDEITADVITDDQEGHQKVIFCKLKRKLLILMLNNLNKRNNVNVFCLYLQYKNIFLTAAKAQKKQKL